MLWKLQQCLLNDWLNEWHLNSFIAALSHVLASPGFTLDTWIYFCINCPNLNRFYLLFYRLAFFLQMAHVVILRLEVVSESPGKLAKMGIVGFHPQSFWFSETEIRPVNLHFQVPQRCWASTLRTTECHLPSPWGHIPCICCLFSISHFKSYSHLPPHSTPETANGHNIPLTQDPHFPRTLFQRNNNKKANTHMLRREQCKIWLRLFQGLLNLGTIDMLGGTVLCCVGLSCVF